MTQTLESSAENKTYYSTYGDRSLDYDTLAAAGKNDPTFHDVEINFDANGNVSIIEPETKIILGIIATQQTGEYHD